MPGTLSPHWQQLALIALGAAMLLILLQQIPVVGRVIRFVTSIGLLAICFFVLLQQAPNNPILTPLLERLNLDQQRVVGSAVTIRMSPDGHFWANATVNGVERRMLVDSGATLTAISDQTAASAQVPRSTSLVPVVLRTANGLAPAGTGTVKELRVGNVRAENLNVLITPALTGVDILGMNFLSKLESWRVEGRTLVMVPRRAEARRTS